MDDATRIRYSSEIFLRQRRGGASRMFAELLREFTTRPELGIQPVIGPWLHRNDHLATVQLRRVRAVRRGSPLDRRSMLRPLDAALERWSGAADLEHPTYYDARHLDRSAGRGLVTTVLDMIPEMLPGQVRAESHESKLALVSASSLVVCISEAVRTDLLRIAGDPGVPVIACPLGVRIDTDPVPTIDERPGAPPIALFVGSRAGYKRFDVLLAALSGAGAPQLDLVCVGGGPWTAPEQQAIGSLAEGVTARQVDADDDELRDWYRRARVLVSTSAGEGFGLPVLEAMAAGCPVVATDIPVYREVVGAAGTFVPVGEPEALRDGIGRVVGDSAAARRAASTGLEVAREASWSRSAERLAAAYRSIR